MAEADKNIKRLTKLNDELENYFRNTIIPQLFVDGDLILRKFTPPAMMQFNLADEDIGKPISEIKENFRYPSIADNIQQVIESKEIREKEIQTTDFRWYQMNIIPYVELVNDKANGVIITFVEITVRIKDLKEQEKLISEHEILLDTISHDFKTPLTSLALSVGRLKKMSKADSPDFLPILDIVDNGIRKMQNIIQELTASRQEEHKYKAEEELLNFEHILEDVRLTLRDLIKESDASIKIDIGVSELTYSRRKLRSIIYNLVSNAIKFRSPDRKPVINISTVKEDDFILISVKDNGIGMESSTLDSIFSKYFRKDKKIEGSGIGLYLVREIVNNSGGRITAESRPGEGSEFKVYLKA
ncbi:GHKL domain-containing protein [Flavihumibacter sp. R14]|nr:GHKL domain-containing protein [Flavihumibacter soli]